MAALPPSPAEMNRRYREFWVDESRKLERRLVNPQLVALATKDMNSEILRSVPLYSQKTIELAFEDAEPKSDGKTAARAADPGRATRFRS